MRDPPSRVIVKIRIVFIRRQLEVTAGHMAGARHVSPARVEPAAGISLCPGSQAALPPCFLTSSALHCSRDQVLGVFREVVSALGSLVYSPARGRHVVSVGAGREDTWRHV